MQITVNGQLLLTMLIEKLSNQTMCQILQANTDGITIKYTKDKQQEVQNIIKWWEELTGLILESNYYSKMIIRDVNNYIAIYTNGKVKNKGAFEINKELHKDNSMLIVPIAIQDYFVKGIPIETTIYKHNNIYNFCKRFKATQGWTAEARYINNNYREIREQQQKNVRYYISYEGSRLVKVHEDKREIDIEDKSVCTIFNKYQNKPMLQYNINYQYYIQECKKMIKEIENKQLTLF